MASDFLLEIDGIKGESQDSKYKETIELESFSWGASNAGSHGAGMGGGSGKVALQDLHCVSHVNKASPVLFLRCCTGEHITKAVLHVRKQGKEQQEYYKVTLENLLVSSYQSGDSTGGSLPTDQFSLNFTKIKFEYKIQNKDGSLGAASTGTWNSKENKE